jgi:uncharacterized repeat protein (TIGR02543 family)
MKKTVMYIVAAAALAVITVIAIIGCNDGVGGDNAGLNNFIGSFVGGGNGGEHTHTWGEWTVTAQATCDAPGLETRTCTQDANHQDSREIARLTGADCDKTYSVTVSNGSADPNNCKAGTAVTVTAGNAPSSNEEFKNWMTTSNNVIFANAANSPTTFIMPANDVSVTAVFGAKGVTAATYTLTVKSSSGGNASADKTTDIAAGSQVNISATPTSGYKFVNWTVSGGGSVADRNKVSTTVTVNADVTVTANFTLDNPNTTTQTYTLTVNRNPTAGGTTTPASSQSNITAGTKVNISATPATGYSFVNWTVTSGNGSIDNANNASTTITVNGNVTIRANFKQNPNTTTYTLTVNRNPTDGGTTTPSSSQINISAGKQVNISATAASGYTFVNWTISGSGTIANVSSAATTVTVNGNVTVTANFNKSDTPKYESCNTSCFWGNNGCAELVKDPTGVYYMDNSGNVNPMPTCDDANKHCERFGGGRYKNTTCSGNPVETDPDVYCNVYCVWDNGNCYELKTDKRGVTSDEDEYQGKIMDVCFDDANPQNQASVVNNCKLWSPPHQTFPTLNACKDYVKSHPGEFKRSVSSLSKSRSSALRAIHTNGTVEVTLPLNAAPKISGGKAELINSDGAVVSSAAVRTSGRSVTAVIPAGADVQSGYYSVRVVLRYRSGNQLIEEASIGIVK